jgi:hypothetical protein
MLHAGRGDEAALAAAAEREAHMAARLEELQAQMEAAAAAGERHQTYIRACRPPDPVCAHNIRQLRCLLRPYEATPSYVALKLALAAGDRAQSRLRAEAAAAEARARTAETALSEATASASQSTKPLLRCTCSEPLPGPVCSLPHGITAARP